MHLLYTLSGKEFCNLIGAKPMELFSFKIVNMISYLYGIYF